MFEDFLHNFDIGVKPVEFSLLVKEDPVKLWGSLVIDVGLTYLGGVWGLLHAVRCNDEIQTEYGILCDFSLPVRISGAGFPPQYVGNAESHKRIPTNAPLVFRSTCGYSRRRDLF